MGLMGLCFPRQRLHPPAHFMAMMVSGGRWLERLEEELFRQGDRERAAGLPISPLFDRTKQGVSKSQVGFYDFVVLPLLHACNAAFPGTQPMLGCALDNYYMWKDAEAVTRTSS